MNASLLVCVALILPIGVIRFVNGNDLYEGDPCKMEDGSEGECVPIQKCPMRIEEVRVGIRRVTPVGRCSFDGFVEIVCCPKEKQPPITPFSITEQTPAPIPSFEISSTAKLTETVETTAPSETTTIINHLPESMITRYYTTASPTTTASKISVTDTNPAVEVNTLIEKTTKTLIYQTDEATVETSNPLIEKATTIVSLIRETSSPLIEIITSTAASKMTEMMPVSTMETTNISDDRTGDSPTEVAINQTAEATLGTSSPFMENITTVTTSSAVEVTSPLMEILTSTVVNRITEMPMTKSTTETTNINGDTMDARPAEIEINQTSEGLEEFNSPLIEKVTTVETPAVDTMSPLMEILTSTVASRITESVVINATTQITNINDNGVGVRPAEAACNEYKKGFLGKDGKTIFLIPILIGEPILKSGEFPFMAALGYKINKDNTKLIKYKCGGTLITTQHILTVAHCVSNADNNVPVEVRLGNINPNDISNSVQIIPVGEIAVHPNYKNGLNHHNVAIIKLSTTVIISQQVMPICLQYTFIPNLRLSINISRIITGWGVTREDFNDLPEIPSLRLIEELKCNELYKTYTSLVEGVDGSIMCLEDKNIMRRTDSCQGNSSGVPLVQVNGDSINVIGIELLSQNCGRNMPGVYVNIYNYLDWIEKVVWPDINKPTIPTIDPELEVRNTFKGETEKSMYF